MLARHIARRALQQASRLKTHVPKTRWAVRQNSSAAGPSSGPRLLTTLVAAAVGGGVGGYMVADFVSPDASKFSERNYEKPNYGGPKEVEAAKKELKALLPASENGHERVRDDKNTLETYGYSHNSYHPEHLHSFVVQALSTEDVVKVVNVSRK